MPSPRSKLVFLGLLASLGATTLGCKTEPKIDSGSGTVATEPMVPGSATLPGDFSPPKDPPKREEPPPVPPPWFGFEPFPGAELLCDEHVAGSPTGKIREIHWAAYATSSPAYEVTAYYKRRDAGAVEIDRDETTFPLGKTVKLSVIRLPTTQPYPRCEKTPKAGQRAVIVISKSEPR